MRGELCLADGAHLHHRLHARRPGLQPLFCLYLSVHVLHADAGHEQQPVAAVFWLGGGGAGVLSADRILVQQTQRNFCQYESLFGQPGGRFWLYFGHWPDRCLHWHPELCRGVCQVSRTQATHLPRNRLAAGQRDLHLPVHWCHGQISPVSAACLAA